MHHATNTTHETQGTVSRILYRIRQTGAVDRIRYLAEAIGVQEPASLKPLFILIIALTAVAIAA